MEHPYQATSDVHVLPSALPVPGLGVLPVNAFVLRAEEPVLVDTGLGVDAEQFVEAVDSIVGLAELRWLWLTHDDADHTGCVARILAAAPNARLVCHGMAAMRLSTWAPVPLDRVHAIRPGDRLAVGDRTLRAIRPPLYDNPMTVGFLDEATGALFSSDAFGAIIPEPVQQAEEVPAEALAGGMVGWAASDSPWAHLVEPSRLEVVFDAVRHLQPADILSSHLPAASGRSLDRFIDVLRALPGSEPDVGPSHEEFSMMLEMASVGAA